MICYDYINNYIRDMIPKSVDILKEMEEYAKDRHVPIVLPEVARFIIVVGMIKRPKRILEIGTAIGYSAITMSQVLEEGGMIDTIEINDEMATKARENIKRANLDNKINVILGDAREVLLDIDAKYDMLFIDAAKGQYFEFLEGARNKLNDGAIIMSDNVLYKGMVASDELVDKRKKTLIRKLREYAHSICNDASMETAIIPIGDGVALSFLKFARSGEDYL
ncbi:MAG: O-methyltransferase [Clostridiales bacterium]|nr:O-methyltransferase [Clostridiales bacterium]